MARHWPSHAHHLLIQCLARESQNINGQERRNEEDTNANFLFPFLVTLLEFSELLCTKGKVSYRKLNGFVIKSLLHTGT